MITQTTGLAADVARAYHAATTNPLPVQLRMWDGSRAGAPDAPVVTLSDPAILRQLLRHPNQLGLANAYITGDVEVEGDIVDALRRLLQRTPRRGLGRLLPMLPLILRLARSSPPPPRTGLPTPARVAGRTHSHDRDRAVIAHHYDLSNDFYALILDTTMAYSCAYWTSTADRYGLADAQRDKLALIVEKLRLGRDGTLLDLGCGWGSLAIHAATAHGARVTAVTLSAQQHRWVTDRVTAAGVDHLVDVRHRHFEDVNDGPYDAIACIEMGEHVGDNRYPAFANQLRQLLRPDGRVLIQQMSRRGHAPGGGPFIETYIAPDMHMRPIGSTIDQLEQAGLEVLDVQAMRAHYARTILAWLANLENQWDTAVRLIGQPTARMWRLYLAGAALAFEQGRMGVNQILLSQRTCTSQEAQPRRKGRMTGE